MGRSGAGALALVLAFGLGTGSVRPAAAGSARTAASRVAFYARKVREAPRPDASLLVATALRATVLAAGGRRIDRVPLGALRPVHARVTESAKITDERREAALRAFGHEITARGAVDLEIQARAMPSKNPLLVVARARGGLIVLDGNSRLRALHAVFGESSAVLVDVVRLDASSRLAQSLLERLLARRGMR